MATTLMDTTPPTTMFTTIIMDISIMTTSIILFQVSRCKKVLSVPTPNTALLATTSAQRVVYVYLKAFPLLLLQKTAHSHLLAATADNTSTSTLAPVSVLSTHSLFQGFLPQLLYLEDLFALKAVAEEETAKHPREVDERAAKGGEEMQRIHW